MVSLSAGYQRGLNPDDYEVVVVDNGSKSCLDESLWAGLAGDFQLVTVEDPVPSPARAANLGLARARGDVIGLMIDGARLATPGLIHFARRATELYDCSVVTTLGWMLGYDSRQRWAVDSGYTTEEESELLESIAWPDDGYRLFEIAAPDGSSADGGFAPIGESTALFLRRSHWETLEGLEERFSQPGGGLVNLDLYRRAVELPGARAVILLGEGAFHQWHEGAASGASIETFPETFQAWTEEYQKIRGRTWVSPRPMAPAFLGTLPRPALRHFVRAAIRPVRSQAGSAAGAMNLLEWYTGDVRKADDPTAARLVHLVMAEIEQGRFSAASAAARIARASRHADEVTLRLLSLFSPYFPGRDPEPSEVSDVALARGDAYRIVGDEPNATAQYRAALTLDPSLVRAHQGLAALRMPGEGYLEWLRWLHAVLRPHLYLEIGVARGQTLALARPPSVAVGVDPTPGQIGVLTAETHLFCETSDDFFGRKALDPLLGDRKVGLAFIDGLHQFEQVLRDFLNIEAYCGAESVVLLHDAVPLDEITQRTKQETQFWTGDVWKAVLSLRHGRPDLDVFTVACGPTGLTFITGFRPGATPMTPVDEDVVARFAGLPFRDVESRLADLVDLIPNDRAEVARRLRSSGIPLSAGVDVQESPVDSDSAEGNDRRSPG
jgi:hypothetical protein